jgi:two-component system chemotaxis sensor kinase CheA
MGFGDDEDILQDFLVEAGEILEHLSEQLVELEQRPNDKELLNAIFRGFHTVKGGAGFLQLEAMVDCCHVTENLFDILRTGKRSVTSELMDVVLGALDTINVQFKEVSQFEKPTPADPKLIAALEALVKGEPVSLGTTQTETVTKVESAAAPTDGEFSEQEYEELLDAISDSSTGAIPAASPSGNADEITEEEFEALLDQLHGKGTGPSKPEVQKPPKVITQLSKLTIASATNSADEISESEFDALLDQLHGKGKGPSIAAPKTKSPAPSTSAPSTSPKKNDDPNLITEDEFEALLDQLHGKGKKTSTETDSTETVAAKPAKTERPASRPAPVTAPKHTVTASKQTQSKSEPPAKAAASNQSKIAAPKHEEKIIKGAPPVKGKDSQPQANVAATETTVRVDTQRLDDIMNMVGELVLVRNRLVRLGLNSNDEALSKAVANLDVVTADLQTSVMKTRMQPIKKVFGRFPRVVRDLARNLKKEINLELQGEDTDLDKNLVEALADPLVHLVRNAVDHGIENPADREAAGKNRVGRVVLAAEQEGDHILLSITDDGAGMDPVKLRQKAVEKGIMDEDAAGRLTDQEAFNLIFAPGFSTKVEISDVSGRGVGMDVVKTKITQLNGSIEIGSKVGEGSRITIKVPLTLAIMPTLMIMLDAQTFALPLVSVNEIFHMDLSKANIVDGQECLTIRNKAIPIFHLKRWLVHKHETQPAGGSAHVVIVSVGTQRVGFVVDQLIGQEEVVIKPLGKMLHGTPGMAGATITGDGTIALILDVPSMLKRYAKVR